ncbi:MAG: hypothetical protein FJW40_03930 [Acidobacteria bacterium]|nr:hypothetical protein [Acidobacteriota bacterium]
MFKTFEILNVWIVKWPFFGLFLHFSLYIGFAIPYDVIAKRPLQGSGHTVVRGPGQLSLMGTPGT